MNDPTVELHCLDCDLLHRFRVETLVPIVLDVDRLAAAMLAAGGYYSRKAIPDVAAAVAREYAALSTPAPESSTPHPAAAWLAEHYPYLPRVSDPAGLREALIEGPTGSDERAYRLDAEDPENRQANWREWESHLAADYGPESSTSGETSPECASCNDTRWTDDENWQPEQPGWDGTRSPAAGLIPCGACNHGGWDVPVGLAAAGTGTFSTLWVQRLLATLDEEREISDALRSRLEAALQPEPQADVVAALDVGEIAATFHDARFGVFAVHDGTGSPPFAEPVVACGYCRKAAERMHYALSRRAAAPDATPPPEPEP